MEDPLYSWMTRMNLVDIYPIFQKNGISLNQVTSLSTSTLNEMGVNIGQRKRIFAATGRPVTPNASIPAPSYAAASFGQIAPMSTGMPPMVPQMQAPQSIIINNSNSNSSSDDSVTCCICNGTRKAKKIWFVRTLVYIDGKLTRDHVDELSSPFWLKNEDGCRACQKTGRLFRKAHECPDCNGQGVSLLTINKVTKSHCCGNDEVVLKDRNMKNCSTCLGDGIIIN